MPIYPTELNVDADVYSSDGEKLGTLHRVVIRRSDLSVTNVVVDIGFLRSGRKLWEGGVGLDYDRVVPVDAIESATEDRVTLKLSHADFKDAPEYTAESFAPPQDMTPNEFDIPDVVNRLQGIAGLINSTNASWVIEDLNKAPDSVQVTEGSPVWRQDPHEKLGEVEKVLLDESTGRLKAFVIRKGFVLKKDIVLPVRYVSELIDDIVRIEISDLEIEQLREWHES